MRSLRFWRLISIFAVITLIGVLGQTVVADEKSPQEDDGSIDAIVNLGAGTPTDARMISQNAASTTGSTTYVSLTGTTMMTTTASSLFRATFSGESSCYGGGGGADICTLRIVIDGVAMNPASGTNFAFDSTNGGRETRASTEAHSIQRFSNCVPAGEHFISVQYAVVNNEPIGPAPLVFQLDDWVFTVERLSSCVP